MKLSDLKPRQKAIVKKIGDELGELKNRLLELGMLEGKIIEFLRRAPLNDPIEIKIDETKIALREEDAKMIEVEPISEDKK